MKSSVVKRSIVIRGHKTSVSLEDAFWQALKEIARAEGVTLSSEVAAIDAARENGNLSSAIRLFVLDRVRAEFARRHDRPTRSDQRPAAAALPQVEASLQNE